MPFGARGNIQPDVGPVTNTNSKDTSSQAPTSNVVVFTEGANSSPSARSTETPDVVIYSPLTSSSEDYPVLMEKPPKKPRRNNFVATGGNVGSSVPKLDVYEPSMGEKVQWWFERNKSKIPFVSFLDELNNEVKRAEKEILVESAYKDDSIRAALLGFEVGLVKGSILLPVTVAETGASLIRGVKRGAEKQDSISGWLGLQHGNPLKDKGEMIRGKSYEEELSDKLIIAQHAPGVYEAQKRLEQAKALEPEANALLAEGEKLQEQYKWFEEMAPKAQESPFLAEMYNMEARNFNQQVMDYNRRVEALQKKYESLNVEGAVKTIDDFNKNVEKVSKFMLVGEIAGSAVGTTVMANIARTLDFHFGPERATTRRVVIKEPGGTRVVEKTTIYKGLFNKRPVSTGQVSFLVKGDALPEGVPFSMSDDIARTLKATANADDIVYTRALKVSEGEGALHVRFKDSRIFELNKELTLEGFDLAPGKASRPVSAPEFVMKTGKAPFFKYSGEFGELVTGNVKTWPGTESSGPIRATRVEKSFHYDFTPEFTLRPSGKMWGIKPEEWNLLQKITRAKTIFEEGGKWTKVSVSGNVAQRVYDPPIEGVLDNIQKGLGAHRILETGGTRVNVAPTPGLPKAVPAPPLTTGVGEFEVVVPDIDIKAIQGVVPIQAKTMARKTRIKRGQSQRGTYREEEGLLPWEKDLEAYLRKHRLEYRKRFNITTKEDIGDTPKPLDIHTPDTTDDTIPIEIGGEHLDIYVPEIEVQEQKMVPTTLVTTLTLPKTSTPPTPPKIKPPKMLPPFAKPRRGGGAFAFGGELFGHTAWQKRYGNDLFKFNMKGIEGSLKAMERSLAKLETTLGGKRRRRRKR